MNQADRSINFPAQVNRGDHIRGSASARVTLIEYGDFGCPACGQAYHAVKILLKHFGDDLRFIFRHFPLREAHPHAEMAAEAAESAGAQHKFWPMHDLLFENQLHLKEKSLRIYADSLELDMARYDQDLDDHIYLQRIQESIESGMRGDIRSTPAFFVNGVLHDVSFDLDHLGLAIATELADRQRHKSPSMIRDIA
jgi:protein-disulfide isomerase